MTAMVTGYWRSMLTEAMQPSSTEERGSPERQTSHPAALHLSTTSPNGQRLHGMDGRPQLVQHSPQVCQVLACLSKKIIIRLIIITFPYQLQMFLCLCLIKCNKARRLVQIMSS